MNSTNSYLHVTPSPRSSVRGSCTSLIPNPNRIHRKEKDRPLARAFGLLPSPDDESEEETESTPKPKPSDHKRTDFTDYFHISIGSRLEEPTAEMRKAAEEVDVKEWIKGPSRVFEAMKIRIGRDVTRVGLRDS
jgi:hypothetical protein